MTLAAEVFIVLEANADGVDFSNASTVVSHFSVQT